MDQVRSGGEQPEPKRPLSLVSLFEGEPVKRPTVTLAEFLRGARVRFKQIFTASAIAIILAVILTSLWIRAFTHLEYTAQMTVTPNPVSSSLGATNANISGLSSFVGLSNASSDQFFVYLEVRKANLLAERLWQIPGLPQNVFGGMWDANTKTWHRPAGFLEGVKDAARELVGFNQWTPPGPQDLAGYIGRTVTVEMDRRTYITKFGYPSDDPQFAAKFLTLIHEEAENILRAAAEQRTKAMVDHLLGELQTVTVAEHRAALAGLLSDSEKQLMLLDKKLPVAAFVIDPPRDDAPPQPFRPLVMLAMAIFGALVAVLLAFSALILRDIKKRRREA